MKINKLVKTLLIAILVGVGLLAAGIGGYFYRGSMLNEEEVIEVVDGDTFSISNGQSIRLKGLDAPELTNCYSTEAKKMLEKLVLNKKVVLREPRVDAFRRVMALVYVDGVFVNEYMIRNGFALYETTASSKLADLLAANEYARKNNLGIFSSKCYQTDPPDPKCMIKGNISNEGDRKLYYSPSCSYYSRTVVMLFRGEKWFCSENEAKNAGFVKSKECP